VPVPLVLVLSGDSVEAFRGVTPWKVWNMPPCVGTGMDGAIVNEVDGDSTTLVSYLWRAWGRPARMTPGRKGEVEGRSDLHNLVVGAIHVEDGDSAVGISLSSPATVMRDIHWQRRSEATTWGAMQIYICTLTNAAGSWGWGPRIVVWGETRG